MLSAISFMPSNSGCVILSYHVHCVVFRYTGIRGRMLVWTLDLYPVASLHFVDILSGASPHHSDKQMNNDMPYTKAISHSFGSRVNTYAISVSCFQKLKNSGIQYCLTEQYKLLPSREPIIPILFDLMEGYEGSQFKRSCASEFLIFFTISFI